MICSKKTIFFSILAQLLICKCVRVFGKGGRSADGAVRAAPTSNCQFIDSLRNPNALPLSALTFQNYC